MTSTAMFASGRWYTIGRDGYSKTDSIRQVAGNDPADFSRLGLGLALVKQIVDQHHGRIEIIDRHVAGTCFRVTLPSEEVSAMTSSTAATGARPDPRRA